MLIRGDARFLPLRDQSVHCVITSPPYYGLRDYGTATWEAPRRGVGRTFKASVGSAGRGALTVKLGWRSRPRRMWPRWWRSFGKSGASCATTGRFGLISATVS